MNRAKNEIVASIARAKLELEDALEDLKSLPMLDPMVLGFIAHAMNNYLHISRGTVELLGDALKDHPDRQVTIWLEGLKDLTGRMGNLVLEMQARPSKSPPQMRFELVDLSLLVSRACDFYRRVASRKQIEIIFEKPSPPLPKVRTDRIAVAAILDNLLSNSVKFSSPRRQVTVAMKRDGDSVVCQVQDEGPGVRTEDRAKLFQGNSRAKTKPAGDGNSTGYGLVVAAELVAHLGGEIGCESDSRKGARFFFRLPCPRSRSVTKRHARPAR